MVSISNVSAGQAKTYFQQDNYYLQQQGFWTGKGAEALGLTGEIKEADFANLLEGKDRAGNQIIRAGGTGEHRAGLDMTFSAPKSASILSEVCGDEKVREAHQAAVENTLKHLEERYSQCRQTQDGITERVTTSNLVIAKFDHSTSRELDPQLHTHAVVINMTQRADGAWRALSNEQLYEQKMYFGQYYRNELAANLKDIGYTLQSDARGLFEVQGVDKELIETFSQRSEQINLKVKELQESGKNQNMSESKLREIATLGSRVAKKNVDIDLVKEVWKIRLEDEGHIRQSLIADAREAGERSREAEQLSVDPKLSEYDYVRQAARILTENESTFSREELLKAAGKLSVGEYRLGEMDKAAVELEKSNKEIVHLGQEHKGREAYTTHEMLKIEKSIIKRVEAGRDKAEPIMTPERGTEALKNWEATKQQANPDFQLSDGQKAAAEHILSTADRYIAIQGDAGTGKTTMLSAAKDQAVSQGYEVRGLAVTGKASDELEKAGIKSQTIDSFFAQQREGQKENTRNEKEVWIVDEASMLGSRKLDGLMHEAEKQGAKVILIGDKKQLQSIEAGQMFERLQDKEIIKTTHMSEVLRQQNSEYKNIVNDVSDKRIDSAVQKFSKGNNIHEISNRDERINMVVKDYTSSSKHEENLIVTAKNTDKNEMNYKVRDELKKQDKLDQKDYFFKVRESKNLDPMAKHFAQNYERGDIVISQKKSDIGKAGSEFKVIESDSKNHKLTLQDVKGKEVRVGLETHGENLSVFAEKAQAFSEGERVIFGKNDRGLDVKNGQTGAIKSIETDGRVKVEMDSGKKVDLNISSQYNYIDHAYAVTAYKAQGQTSREVIYHADTQGRGVNYNEAYVAITRGRDDVKIYTDSKINFTEQIKESQQKTSTLDYTNKMAGPEIEAGAQVQIAQERGHETASSAPAATIEKGGIER